MHKMFKLHSKVASATSSTTSFSGVSSGASGGSTNGFSSSPGPRMGIYLVGATYLDTIMHVHSFPHEDSKQRAERVEQRRGGNAANTAEILGQDPRAKVWYMSSMPSPAASKILLRALEENNVKTESCVFHSDQLTPPQAYIISALDTGTRTIISHSTLPDLTLEEFIKKFDAACMKAGVSDLVQMNCPFRWIHFDGRGVEVYKMIDHVESVYIRQGWRQKLTISVEFEKGDRPGIKNLLQQADVCFFSKLYAETLGFDRPEDFLSSIGDYCKPTATIFCCWGAMGAVGLHLESRTSFSSSAGKVNMVVDPVGASDAFIAGIILGLGVRGYDIGRGLRFGCELATLKCSQYGFKRLLKSIPPDL
ncbi:Ribokinase-like protein [Mortierella sp. GBAus27b]|nr:Ribokinase-like protein [Mortierella sp. GBAus27b]